MAMGFGLDEALGSGGMLTDNVTLPAVGSIAPDLGLLAMQQLGQHLTVMHMGRGGHDRMNQLGAAVHAHMRLHAKVPLVPLLRLMHLQILLLRPILRRTGDPDDSGIHNGSSAHLEPLRRQILSDPGKELLAQLVGFQEMPKLTDRRLIGHRARDPDQSPRTAAWRASRTRPPPQPDRTG